MAKLTDEELKILQQAKMIKDRLEAEKLEAGEEKKTAKQPSAAKTMPKQPSAAKAVPKQPSAAQNSSRQAAAGRSGQASGNPYDRPRAPYQTGQGYSQAVKRPAAQDRASVYGGAAKVVPSSEHRTVTKPTGGSQPSGYRAPVKAARGAQASGYRSGRTDDTNQRTGSNAAGKPTGSVNASGRAHSDENEKKKTQMNSGIQPEREKKMIKKKKKKRSPLKILLEILLGLILLLAVALGVLFFLIRGKISETNYQPYKTETGYIRAADVISDKHVKNILLLGTDERDTGAESRSDAIILLSINEKTKKIVLTSILRDSYVAIPGYGQNRINHAYQMGGAPLMIQTIEENFKIGIDSYAKVDFYSFMDIIDALGGVNITVTQDELQYVNGYISEINHIIGAAEGDQFLPGPGTYQLNGRQALAYSRIRYIGTDFARTERQRTVLEGLFRQAQTASVQQLYRAFTQILPDITTDIGDSDFTLLLFKSIFYMGYDMIQNRVPMDGTWQNADANGQEVLSLDFAANQAGLRNIIYEDGQ